MNTSTLIISTNKAEKISLALLRAREDRATIVAQIIREVINLSNENKEIFSSRKTAKKFFLNELKKSSFKEVDSYVKRAFNVAEKIILDGYSVKYELLSIAQMEQLTKFSKSRVKKLFALDDEAYIEAVKELIASAKVEKTVKVFSARKAKEI